MSTPLAPPPPRPCSWAQWFPGRRVARSPGRCLPPFDPGVATWKHGGLGAHVDMKMPSWGVISNFQTLKWDMGNGNKISWERGRNQAERKNIMMSSDMIGTTIPLRPKWHDNLAISRGLTPANSHRKNPLSVHTLWGKKYHLQPLRKILILELTWTSYCRKIIPWCVFK